MMSASQAEATGRVGGDAAAPWLPARNGMGRRRPWLRLLHTSPTAVVSLVFLLALALLALFAPALTPFDPELVDPAVRLEGPSSAHWLGTDELGRDVFTRLIYGGRISLLVGAGVTVIAALVGSILGLVAGYYRRLDGLIMRVMDGLMAFPGLLLAIAIVVSLGPHAWNVILALALVYTPIVARLVRGTTLVIRRLPYVESARCIGLPDRTILRRYIIANAISPLIVQCTFIIAYAMLAEASLSYLGASVDPETPTWGNMLREGQRLLSRAWWIGVFPGIALFLTVLALILCGESLRDTLDPRTHQHRERGVRR